MYPDPNETLSIKKFFMLHSPKILKCPKILYDSYRIVQLDKIILDALQENKSFKTLKKLYFSNKDIAISWIRNLLIEEGVICFEEENFKMLKTTKEDVLKNKIAPIYDPKKDVTFFYSIELNKVVPMSPNHYKKLLKLDQYSFDKGVTCTELYHDFERQEGSDGERINSHNYYAYLYLSNF